MGDATEFFSSTSSSRVVHEYVSDGKGLVTLLKVMLGEYDHNQVLMGMIPNWSPDSC